jgi:hypothetical protein
MVLMRRRAGALFAVIVGSAAISGCWDDKPYIDTSHREATVTGVVKVKGVPATGGTILFNPSNSGRLVPTRSAPIGPDGSYTIKTLTGVNQVSFEVVGEAAAKNRGIGLIKEGCDVQPGSNNADFDLLGEGSGKKILYPTDGKAAGKGGPKKYPAR